MLSASFVGMSSGSSGPVAAEEMAPKTPTKKQRFPLSHRHPPSHRQLSSSTWNVSHRPMNSSPSSPSSITDGFPSHARTMVYALALLSMPSKTASPDAKARLLLLEDEHCEVPWVASSSSSKRHFIAHRQGRLNWPDPNAARPKRLGRSVVLGHPSKTNKIARPPNK